MLDDGRAQVTVRSEVKPRSPALMQYPDWRHWRGWRIVNAGGCGHSLMIGVKTWFYLSIMKKKNMLIENNR